MKTFNSLLVTSLLCATTQAYAGYNCPAASSTGGGWTPPECTQAASVVCADCGTVDQVSMIEVEDASGLGAAAGAVAGGLLGNQIGGGTGKKVATVAGAAAGGPVAIKRFERFVLGEGLEKKESDFAAEVAAAAGL